MTRLFLAKILGLAGGLWLAVSSLAAAAPPMWLASDEDTRIYLFGSVHILPKDTQWRTPALDDVLDEADAVYFETSLDMADQQAMAAETMKLGLVSGGTRLLDRLDTDEKAIVTDAAREAGIPLSGLNIWKPWMATNLLTTSFAAKQGFDILSGVDVVLQGELAYGEQRFFETIDEQLHFLADMPEDQQITALVATARDLKERPDMLIGLVDAWSAGDVESLRAALSDSLDTMDANWDETLLHQRNVRWVAELEDVLKNEPGTFLVVVGAAHLVGDNNVPSLLADAGIKVERVQ